MASSRATATGRSSVRTADMASHCIAAGEPRRACLDGSQAAATDWAHTTERWREQQAAKQEEQRRRAESQREPGESYAWPLG